MDDRAFLAKRRDRAIASFMGFKERQVDRHLPDDVAFALRKEFLDHINELCNLAFDLMDSGSNEEFISRIDAIYDIVSAQSDMSTGLVSYSELRDGT